MQDAIPDRVRTVIEQCLRESGVPARERERLRVELEDHFHDAIDEARARGASIDHAIATAIRRFGPPQHVANAFRRESVVADLRSAVRAPVALVVMLGVMVLHATVDADAFARGALARNPGSASVVLPTLLLLARGWLGAIALRLSSLLAMRALRGDRRVPLALLLGLVASLGIVALGVAHPLQACAPGPSITLLRTPWCSAAPSTIVLAVLAVLAPLQRRA
ncbi:MAG: permease prefix domain 1-containing protein [Gemmatimonadaceae bacterium]